MSKKLQTIGQPQYIYKYILTDYKRHISNIQLEMLLYIKNK